MLKVDILVVLANAASTRGILLVLWLVAETEQVQIFVTCHSLTHLKNKISEHVCDFALCSAPGGPLAVTDANLVLGRLLPEYFPKIFGVTEDQPLDKEAACKAFAKLTKEVGNNYKRHLFGESDVLLHMIGQRRQSNTCTLKL